MSDFVYSEARLARVLGLNRDALVEFRGRELVRGSDWDKNGAWVAFSKDGVRKIEHFFGVWGMEVDLDEALVDWAIKGEEKVAQEKNFLEVVQKPLNRRLVWAVDSRGATHSVDVGVNDNFLLGDKIEVAPHPLQAGVLILVGDRPKDKRRLPEGMAAV